MILVIGSSGCLVIAALLLHDLKKNGEGLDSRGKPTLADATAFHGVYLGEQIEKRLYPPGKQPPVRIQRIIAAIKTHMGRWTMAGHPQPESEVEVIVHLADYCASRKVDAATKAVMV